MQTHTTIRALTALTATLMCASPILAQDHVAERQITIRYNDLDLSQAAGQDILYKRIKHAVTKVCRSHEAKNPADRPDVIRCETKARAQAQQAAEYKIAEYNARKNRFVSVNP